MAKQRQHDIDKGLVIIIISVIIIYFVWHPIIEWICVHNILKGEW
jgi:hypothetical protein